MSVVIVWDCSKTSMFTKHTSSDQLLRYYMKHKSTQEGISVALSCKLKLIICLHSTHTPSAPQTCFKEVYLFLREGWSLDPIQLWLHTHTLTPTLRAARGFTGKVISRSAPHSIHDNLTICRVNLDVQEKLSKLHKQGWRLYNNVCCTWQKIKNTLIFNLYWHRV